MCSEISKQDYLKRYVEKEKKRKRKVKTVKSILPKVKIVHENVDIKSIKFGNKEDTDEEESPVIAEVVDERPIEIKSKEIYQSSRWKRLGEEESETCFDKENSKTGSSPFLKKKRLLQNSESIHDFDNDLSPPRPHQLNEDQRPSEKENHFSKRDSKETSKHLRHDSDSDLSPIRSNQRKSPQNNSDSDLSPPREMKLNSDDSTKRNTFKDLPRTTLHSESALKNKGCRPVKTLSGLKAGLQNAATLQEETKAFKIRERSRIDELDDELSGRNAGTIVRGQKKNAPIEDEKKLAEQQQKYDKWGKGLIQGESKNQKLMEDLYETSKPLARYCDDEDLEEKQKSIIHDDDPMAQYMRKKKQKHAVDAYPAYSGPPPPPNRFGIRPGYRWDGVDRSNGFEKKYFEQKSNRKATEEEAYLWSVQDM